MTFTPQTRIALRKAYDKAVAAKADTFMFGGQELVTGYAKYLLQYLDGAAASEARQTTYYTAEGAPYSPLGGHGADWGDSLGASPLATKLREYTP